jgi:hypothetical protein
MFCATAADCAHGLGCFGRHCCGNEQCDSICQSLVEKDPDLSQSLLSGHPSLVDYFRRRCHQRCCQGESAKILKETLRVPLGKSPSHIREVQRP